MFLENQRELIFKSFSLILVIFSLIVAFLIYQEMNKTTLNNLCIIGDSCFNVWQSKYGFFLNIEWVKWGIVYSFFLLLFLIYDILFFKNFKFLLFFYFLGAVVSFYLIFLQIFILKEICYYCLTYDFLIIILFLFNFFKNKIIYFFSKSIKASK